MSMREQAIALIEKMSEDDLQMFLSLFGRLYQLEATEKSDVSESIRVFHELDQSFSDEFEDLGCLDCYSHNDDLFPNEEQLKKISEFFSSPLND